MGNGRLAVVVTLFLASVAALVASSVLALSGSGDELAARDQLRDATAELAAARDPVDRLPADRPGAILPEPDNRRLAAVARRVLANYEGAEGGFYLARSDQFAGAALTGPDPPGPVGEAEPWSAETDPKAG